MIYRFFCHIYNEGVRSFIKIPFNVWDEIGLKGNIPCKVSINNISFECKLLPKGNGNYLIPITKKVLSYFKIEEEYEVELEPLHTLSRINHDSPYSKENPIRKINCIEAIKIQPGFCGHCCVAMLAGIPLSGVLSVMGKEHASWSKILETLDYYGISYAPKAVYTKGKSYQLPNICIVNNDNRFILWYKDAYVGIANVDQTKTISYIEIYGY